MTRFPVVLLAVLALAWGEDKPKEIRIASGAGATPSRPFAGGIFGHVGEQGLLEQEFAKDGITVRWEVIKGAGPGVNEAFANGSLDFALYGDFPAIIGRAAGIRTKVLFNTTRGNDSYLVVQPGSTVGGIKQLVGQRVSTHKGRPTELAFDWLLESEGLRQSDFRIFNLPPADGQAALAAKGIDGYFGGDGYLLEQNGTGRIVWSSKGRDPHLKFTSELFGTEEFVAKYPEATQRLVTVFIRAYHKFSLEKNREAFLQLQVKSGQLYEVAAKDLDGVALKARNNPLVDDYLLEHYRRYAAKAKARNLIRSEVPDVPGWFDRRFVDAAVVELGLEGFWTPVSADGANLGYR